MDSTNNKSRAGREGTAPFFDQLSLATSRPGLWSRYTAVELWTDPHIAGQMLKFHLNPDSELASRNPEFIERSGKWITDRFGVGSGTRVLDLGCGPGLYTMPLARIGADVTGVDFSESSLNHARARALREGLSIDYVLANYLEYEPAGKFDLITLIYWDLCPLSPAQRRTLLNMCRGCLSDGGAILLDVPSMKYFESVEDGKSVEYAPDGGFWSAEPYFVLKTTFKYDADSVTLDKYTLVEPERTREIYNWLQSYSPESLKREFAECGLEVAEVLGDVAGAPYDPESTQMAIVARCRA